METRLLVANWKANPEDVREAVALFDSVKAKAARLGRTKLIICPPLPFLGTLRARYKGTKLSFGAQDVSAAGLGAHTGEVSARMLQSAGVSHVIVGHSERRKQGETDAEVAKKLAAALEAKLVPILCVGESSRDADGVFFEAVRTQLDSALSLLAPATLKRLVIAYEPVWAVGKDAVRAIDPHDLHTMVIFIRKALAGRFGRKAALSVPVLYGGSVEAENAAPLISSGKADGLLVGRQSLHATAFSSLMAVLENPSRYDAPRA